MQDPQPAVTHGTGGEKLDGIRQATASLTDGVVEDAGRQPAVGGSNHIAADENPRGGVAVKGLHHIKKFLPAVSTDIHLSSF